MKITKQQLKQIVKEELMNEISFDRFMDEKGLGPDSEPVGSMGALGAGSEPMDPKRALPINLLEDVMKQISAAYDSLKHPGEQEDFERYLNENVRLMTEEWQEDREYARDAMRTPGER